MSGGKPTPLVCACCGSDCYESSTLRVVCTECTPSLDICLLCFASSVTVGQHKPDHQYRFEESSGFPILNGWSASELFQLLEGLEQFGYGNWIDVSRYVDTKGPAECRDAVNLYFVNGPIGARTYSEDSRGNAMDHTAHLPPPADTRIPQVGELKDELLLGWLPSRDEFEVEYCNSAETLVSGLDPDKHDEVGDDLDVALKLAHVEMYQDKLRERIRRKEAARDLGLVNTFLAERAHASSATKSRTKTELTDKLKFLANVQKADEHLKFVAGMDRERELKLRIRDVVRYRKNGVTSKRDGEEFDAQRIRRNKLKAERKRALEAGLETAPSTSVDLDSISSIVGLPGYDLLSCGEKQLCSSLRLHPNLYTAYKTCLIRDQSQKRRGHIIRPLHSAGLDKSQRKKIFNYLLHSGWISAY